MRHLMTVGLAAGIVALAACGGETAPTSPTGPSKAPTGGTYPAVSGTYLGLVRDESADYLRSVDIRLQVTQADAVLKGTFTVSGQLAHNNMFMKNQIPVDMAGALTGSVTPALRAAVSLTLTPTNCEHRKIYLSGIYDVSTSQLTLDGPVTTMISGFCDHGMTQPATVVFKR